MNLADDSGRRVPCTDRQIAAELLQPEVSPHLDQVLVDHSTLVVHFQTSITALLGELSSSPTKANPRRLVPPPHPAFSFLRDGSCWTIFFAGTRVHLHGADGLAHLAQLLRHPDEDIPAVVLAARLHSRTLKEKNPDDDPAWDLTFTTGARGLPVLDAQAITAYQARLKAMEGEAERARIRGDGPAIACLDKERGGLERALAAGLGLRGRPRLAHGTAERARQNVQKAIAAAIEKAEHEDMALGLHLRQSIFTGTTCVYRPQQPIPWTFS